MIWLFHHHFHKRISQIRKQKENTTSKYDIEKLDERIAKLSGGVAVIRVGAATETEMKYLKLKVEDAVNATKAAKREGIVAGGGVSLIKAAAKVSEKIKTQKTKMTKDFEIGFNIVLKALEAPLRQIMANAGKDDAAVVIEKIRNEKGFGGYDALADIWVADMIVAGIVDPVKVTRSGIENAASAAGVLLTTEVAIADLPEEKKSENHEHGGEY